MSNGARLSAVIVVVVVAAIGLYFAFMTPSAPPRDPEAPVDALKSPEPIGGLGEVSGDAAAKAAEANGVPPAEAFGVPSGVATAGQGSGAAGTPAASAGNGVVPTGTATGTASETRASGPASASAPVIPAAPAAKTAEPAAPALAEYTIKSGDTLEGIARTHLGDGQKWQSIVAANPGLNPKTLKPGQRIKLPAGSDAKVADAPAAGVGAKVSAASNTYTVQKGDTLVAIARKFYGSDAEWKRILEANSSLLKGNASALQPGMKLSIPPKR